MKKILDVGNCGPDHATITAFFAEHFDSQVDQAHGPEDTMAMVKRGGYDLVCINRKLDRDYTDGMNILKGLKADPETADVPVMLVTNLPEHQDAAEAAGAVRGFGKLEYDKPETLQRVRAVLEEG